MFISAPRGRCRGHAATIAAIVGMMASPCVAAPLTETEAIESALAQPEIIELGEANRAEAEARVAGIRRFDNPEASVSRERVSDNGIAETEWQAGIIQPLDLAGRRSRLRAAARAEAGAVEADTARRRHERIAEVRRAYAACAAAEEKTIVTRAFTSRLREAERIVALRANAGDASGYDIRRLRVEARTAEAQAALQQGEVNASCASLASLTGDPNARPSASIALLASARVPASQGPRPDLLAREQRLVAATEQARAAERARIPEVSIGIGFKQIDSMLATASGPVASIGMRVPLFDGGGAAVAEARARQRAREAELGLARREVDASIAAAEARSTAALEAAQRAQQASDDAHRLGTIAEAAYQGGESGVVELVDAYRTARDAELEIIDLLERAVRARIDLDLARGGE